MDENQIKAAARAIDKAIPIVEEIVKQRQVFARVAPGSTRLLAEGEAIRAQGVLNDLCVGVLALRGAGKKW